MLALGEPGMWQVAGPCLAPVWGLGENLRPEELGYWDALRARNGVQRNMAESQLQEPGPCPSPGLPQHLGLLTVL